MDGILTWEQPSSLWRRPAAALTWQLLLWTCLPQLGLAEDVTVQVFDIGGGLCTLTKMPGDSYLVYDVGVGLDVEEPELCAERIDQAMPPGEAIDVLVLSHSDSDHISSVARLLALRRVDRVVRTGHERATKSWCHADYWIKVQVDDGEALSWWKRWRQLKRCTKSAEPAFVPLSPYPPPKSVDFNLAHYELDPGEDEFELGVGTSDQAILTLLHGRHDMPTSWNGHFASNKLTSRSRNAISIVARLEFMGRSVLFTGDSVGLDRDGESLIEAPCVATEGDLVRGHKNNDFDLNSDVLIAPHHGSSNGNCLEFIQLVSPGWAIFTAGHDHSHPSRTAAERYIEAGVPEARLLRTDRGDNEGQNSYEWVDSYTPSSYCHDRKGDDDIVITLNDDGSNPTVRYRQSHTTPCS